MNVAIVSPSKLLTASFPCSPCVRMKNRNERGKPGKIYHVRNVMHSSRGHYSRAAFISLRAPDCKERQLLQAIEGSLVTGKKPNPKVLYEKLFV